MEPWKKWADERPTDHTKLYRWRIPERRILGKMLRPEWTEKLLFCGMGYSESEWWPPFSQWDGYRRSVPEGLEWREVTDADNGIYWGGLDLLPCPFTGKMPTIDYYGRWIGAAPYDVEYLIIKAHMVNSSGWRDANKLEEAWNRRV